MYNNRNKNETRSLRGEETLKKASLAYYKDHRFDLFKSLQRLRHPIVTTATAAAAVASTSTINNNGEHSNQINKMNLKRSSANNSALDCDLNINKIKLKNKYKEYQISSNTLVSPQDSHSLPQITRETQIITKEKQEKISAFPKISIFMKLYILKNLFKLSFKLINKDNHSSSYLKKKNSTFQFRNKLRKEFEKEISSDSIDSFCSREKQLNQLHSTPSYLFFH